MKIIGAGLAGLLAANMLRKYDPVVYESQTSLPDNHGALLRFRSPVVSEVTGIPFRKVRVTKGWKDYTGRIRLDAPSIPDANRYSLKVTGRVLERSIMNMEPCDRWVAPDDFSKKLAMGVNVRLGITVSREALEHWIEQGESIISTIPMPTMIRAMGVEDVFSMCFDHLPILSLRMRLPENVDVYQTIYYPSRINRAYRASITGNVLIVEVTGKEVSREDCDSLISDVLQDFGLGREFLAEVYDTSYQKYGKLIPVAQDQMRKAFILSASDHKRIYSLGRFATWRQILLDDLVQDVRKIESLVSERHSTAYNLRLGNPLQ